MSVLQVLMPMGGLGSRFSKAGYTLPKPLIKVDGIAMFLKALSSLDDIKVSKEIIFVIRKEHVEMQKLDSLIKAALPTAKIVVIPELTNGAVETALSAKTVLDSNQPLVVMDCDLWFKSTGYSDMVKRALQQDNEQFAGLLTFRASDPRYSYVDMGPDNKAIRTAEKEVISDYAITGAYFFSRASLFIDSAQRLIKKPINESMPEYYLSLVYNDLISRGIPTYVSFVDKHASFGTPEELLAYGNKYE